MEGGVGPDTSKRVIVHSWLAILAIIGQNQMAALTPDEPFGKEPGNTRFGLKARYRLLANYDGDDAWPPPPPPPATCSGQCSHAAEL
jgi:hypothetical protein